MEPATFRFVGQCLNQLRHQQRAPSKASVGASNAALPKIGAWHLHPNELPNSGAGNLHPNELPNPGAGNLHPSNTSLPHLTAVFGVQVTVHRDKFL